MIEEFILTNYLGFSKETHDNILFLKPVLKKKPGDTNCYWIDSKTHGHYTADILLLESIYDSYKIPENKEWNIRVEIDMNHPFFLLKINEELFYGSPHELLQKLFFRFSVQQIRSYDLDRLLIRFMIRNKDNKYLVEQYLSDLSTGELLDMFAYILEAKKLNRLHKKDFFTKILKKNYAINNTLFEGFMDLDFAKLENLLANTQYGEEAIEVINEHRDIPYLIC